MHCQCFSPQIVNEFPTITVKLWECDSDSKHTLCNMVYPVFICKNIRHRSSIYIYNSVKITSCELRGVEF